MARILVVEDNFALTQTLMSLLNRYHEVYSAANIREAKQKVKKRIFDLVLLDRQLPDGDGLELISYFADNCNHSLRTLILSAMGETRDVVNGLAEGSDDYLAKPFSLEELHWRIRGLLAKDKRAQTNVVRCGVMVYEIETRCLIINKRQRIVLTKKIGMLLEQLMTHPNQVLTREDLTIAIYDDSFEKMLHNPKSIDVLISRLKKDLREYGRFVKNIYNLGYQFWTPYEIKRRSAKLAPPAALLPES